MRNIKRIISGMLALAVVICLFAIPIIAVTVIEEGDEPGSGTNEKSDFGYIKKGPTNRIIYWEIGTYNNPYYSLYFHCQGANNQAIPDYKSPATPDSDEAPWVLWNSKNPDRKYREVYFSPRISKIGAGVCYNNDWLTIIDMENDVKTIREYAFEGTDIKTVNYNGKESDWEDITIEDHNGSLSSSVAEMEAAGITFNDYCDIRGSHAAQSKWTYEGDETGHWHVCPDCGKKVDETASHSFGEWKTVEEPTRTESGEKQRTCSTCSYVETEEIPPIATLLGDVNYDGFVTDADAQLVADHITRKSEITDTDALLRADINEDKKIDLNDCVLIIDVWHKAQ